jgi:hypothetical protein
LDQWRLFRLGELSDRSHPNCTVFLADLLVAPVAQMPGHGIP